MVHRFVTLAHRGVFALVLMALLSACSSNDKRDTDLGIVDPDVGIEYSAKLLGAPDEEIEELLQKSLKLFSLQHRKPSSEARLRRRAESDMATALAVLKSQGYYNATSTFEMGPDLVDAKAAPVQDDSAQLNKQADAQKNNNSAPSRVENNSNSNKTTSTLVTVLVVPGDIFTLADLSIEPAVTAEGLEVDHADVIRMRNGSPARAAEIVESEDRVVVWLTENGYPYAAYESRTVTANLEHHTLTVVSRLNPGPQVRFADLRFTGLKKIDEQYLRSYTPWKEGDLYSQSAVDRMQTGLFSTSLFESISVEPLPLADFEAMAQAGAASTADAGSVSKNAAKAVPVPITIQATEGKHRSVGAGARFSTDEGPEASAYFEHRNLFGANETGRIAIIGGLVRQQLSLSIRKPQFLLGPNVLFGSLIVRHEDDEAFEERTMALLGGIERRMNKRLTVSGALSLEVSQIDDDLDGDFEVARLLGAPLSARYDASNSLLDPSRGYRIGAAITPYVGTYNDNTLLFTSADVTGSVYFPLDKASRYVLALRGRVGSLLGAERDDLPPTKRLYSGGGGSVRGYESRFIGPLDTRGDPLGGRSVLEGGIEMRIRIGENLGVVPFIDAGTVSREIFPDFSEDVQIAAGLGFRYYTIIGPIRADFAMPVNPREEDSLFQFYISIGQAF